MAGLLRPGVGDEVGEERDQNKDNEKERERESSVVEMREEDRYG